MNVNVVFEREIPDCLSIDELNNHLDAAKHALMTIGLNVKTGRVAEEAEPQYKVTGFTHWGDKRFTDWDKYKGGDINLFMDSCENVLVDYLKANKIKFDPDYHQHGDFGCPIINDTYRLEYSLRGWSSVLARVYGGDYMDYYCSTISEPTLPPANMRIGNTTFEDTER